MQEIVHQGVDGDHDDGGFDPEEASEVSWVGRRRGPPAMQCRN
jgi:hypothetical protein